MRTKLPDLLLLVNGCVPQELAPSVTRTVVAEFTTQCYVHVPSLLWEKPWLASNAWAMRCSTCTWTLSATTELGRSM